MNPLIKAAGLALLGLAAGWSALPGQEEHAGPVTPNASPEARALLQVLHAISGEYTLTGQHNDPNSEARNSAFAARFTGKRPVIFGCDLGFAQDGDADSYLARPDVVREAIRANREGSIVALCWHAVPPTADEPVTFRPLPNADPKMLASVQGQLTDEQFRDLLTPGTALYNHWCAQVDEIASTLAQLQKARVPVLWRPYHEMNGDWFWWGHRTGQYSTIALYRQLFDRLVNVHHLDNLLWVWSVDRVHSPDMAHAKYFPGLPYVDILAMDVYENDFAQSYYDSLIALAQGKPVTLAEVGNPPSLDVLRRQPRWIYYMIWAGMVRNTTRPQYAALYRDPRILNVDDPAYANAIAPYRQAANLPPLNTLVRPTDFSGHWVLVEERSDFGRMGPGMAPSRLDVTDRGDALAVRTTRFSEFADDQVTEENLQLDGTTSHSEFMNSPRTTTAWRTADGRQLEIDSSVAFAFRPGTVMKTKDTWSLQDGGRVLTIRRASSGFRGDNTLTLVYEDR